LAADSPASLGALYEQGAICSKFYKRGAIPSDQELTTDLTTLMDSYFSLVTRDTSIVGASEHEADETDLEWEDLRILRMHKRLERNQRLAQKAKKHHGCTCQACGFNFELTYGPVGKDFIEAHHLTPVSALKGKKVSLNPATDFAVLCA